MKRLIVLLAIAVSFTAYAQNQSLLVDSLHVGKNTTSKAAFTGKVWLKNFNGNRPITNGVVGLNGINPGTNELVAFLNAVFYPSQAPTASISIAGGPAQLELHSAGTFEGSVNWTAGRQISTEPLATVVVDGISQTFTQPTAGASIGGSVAKTVTWNTNTNVGITVTTTDAKTASSTTGWTFLPKRYWGRTSNTAATSAEILASMGGGNVLSSSKSGSFTVTASGSNRIFYAYPSNLGDLSSIVIGGLESIGAFTKTVISFTNASGYTQNYNVYTSINVTGGNVTAITN